MKTNLLAIFLCVFSVYTPLYGIQMQYANTILNGRAYVDKAYVNKVISIDDENPKTLSILGVDCIMDAPYRLVMTAHGSWEEKYLIKKSISISKWMGFSQVRNIGIVTLYKNKQKGVVGVAFSDRPDRIYLFRPGKEQRLDVTFVPNIFINKVQMSNVREDGSSIDDYNSIMVPDSIDCLKVCATYQKSRKDKDVEFMFRVVSNTGKVIRSIEASNGSVASEAADDKHNIQACMQFSKKDLNLIEKGNKLEIYAEGNRLCAVDIPIRGIIVYKPTLVVRVRTSGNEIHCEPFNPGNSIYGKPTQTKRPIITAGRHEYRVLEWREIEL